MTFKLFLPLFVAVMFVGCAVREMGRAPSTTFIMKTFSKKSQGCLENDSTSCASYEVTYPEFSGLTDSVADKIQRAINANVSMGNPEADGWTMEMVADDFIKNFETFAKESPELAGRWYYKAKAEVETLTDTLISISVADEFFTGGAHGGGGKYFISMNGKTAKGIELKDILKVGFEEPLRAEGEKAFRTTHHLLDTASLISNGFEFPNNKFRLNDNYGLTSEGIVFVFNAYEIASYAAGPTEIVIPYERIRGWLKTSP